MNASPSLGRTSLKRFILPVLLIIVLAAVISGGLYYFVNKRNLNQNGGSSGGQSVSDDGKFIYLRGSDEGKVSIVISNFDGSYKTRIGEEFNDYSYYYGSDYYGYKDGTKIAAVSEKTGKIAYLTYNYDEETGDTSYFIWSASETTAPKQETSLRDSGDFTVEPERVLISNDGRKIAVTYYQSGYLDSDDYSDYESIKHLRVLDSVTNRDTLISGLGEYKSNQGLLDLEPVAWAEDDSRMYAVAKDKDGRSVGVYAIYPDSRKIEKVNLPQKVFEHDFALSPDGKKIAYTTTFTHPGSPFTIDIIDLATGSAEKIVGNANSEYLNPVWSGDSQKLAYTVKGGIENGDSIFYMDLNSKKENKVTDSSKGSFLRVGAWLSGGRLIYTESSSEAIDTDLLTIRTDGGNKQRIDSASEIQVLGPIR